MVPTLKSFFWLLVPVVTSLIIFLTSVFTFVGSSEICFALTKSICFYEIDFSKIYYLLDQSNYESTSIAEAAQINPIYRIGAGGYCNGWYTGSKLTIVNCSTPTTPFYLNLRQILSNVGVEHIFDKSNTLERLENPDVIMAVKSIWGILLAVIAISAISFVLSLVNLASPLDTLSTITLLCAILQAGCAITAAVLCFQNNSVVRDVLQKGVSKTGSGTSLIWVMAATSCVGVLWWFTPCCGYYYRSRSKYAGSVRASVGIIPISPNTSPMGWKEPPPPSQPTARSSRANAYQSGKASTHHSPRSQAPTVAVNRRNSSLISSPVLISCARSKRSSRMDINLQRTHHLRKVQEVYAGEDVVAQRKATMKKFHSEMHRSHRDSS